MQRLAAIGVGVDDAGGLLRIRVVGDAQFFAHRDGGHVAHVILKPLEFHGQARADFAQLRLVGEQLAAHLHAGGDAQLLGRDAQPLVQSRVAVAAVAGSGVEAARPAVGAQVERLQAAHGLALERAFKAALDNVLRFFHLAGGAGVARRVGHELHAQTARQVFEQAAGVGAAHVHHEDEGHAVKGVGRAQHAARVDGGNKAFGQVQRAFSAQHVVREDGAAVVVSDHIAPHALALHALQRARLVFVELVGLEHLQAAALAFLPVGEVIEHAEAGVDLPDVVGVQAFHFSAGGGAQQLRRVQAVGAQGAFDGAGA